jgi:hypothetical protein
LTIFHPCLRRFHALPQNHLYDSSLHEIGFSGICVKSLRGLFVQAGHNSNNNNDDDKDDGDDGDGGGGGGGGGGGIGIGAGGGKKDFMPVADSATITQKLPISGLIQINTFCCYFNLYK